MARPVAGRENADRRFIAAQEFSLSQKCDQGGYSYAAARADSDPGERDCAALETTCQLSMVNPPRIVFDFPNTVNRVGTSGHGIGQDSLRAIRLVAGERAHADDPDPAQNDAARRQGARQGTADNAEPKGARQPLTESGPAGGASRPETRDGLPQVVKRTVDFRRSRRPTLRPGAGFGGIIFLFYVGHRTVRLARTAYKCPIDSWLRGRSIQFRLGQDLPATSLSCRRKTPNAGSPMQCTGIHTRQGCCLVVMKNLHKGTHHE